MVRRRKRAASASNAWPEYEESSRHYRESSVLKPVSPSTHTDDWPCFLLSNATVHRQDGSLANQLEVDLDGPFIVRGKLELEKDNQRYLVNRQMKTEDLWIQIESSRAFSVGAKDDSLSVPVVWASGEAGWFEIVPAPCYQRICNTMFQGVCLHYSFLDQYEAALETLQKSKKKKKATLADVSLGLDELLFQYALRAGDGLTLPEAYKRLHQQSIFLLSHFPKDTGVFNYLANKFPSIVRNLANKDASGNTRVRSKAFTGPCPLKAYDYVYSHREPSSSLERLDGKKKGKERAKSNVPRSMQTSEASDIKSAGLPNRSQNFHVSASTRMKRGSPVDARLQDDISMLDSTSNPTPSGTSRDGAGPVHNEKLTVDPNTKGMGPSARVLVDALEDVKRQMVQLISEGKQKKQLNQITAKGWQTKVYMECNIKHYNSTAEIFHYHARDLMLYLGPEWHDTQIYQWIKENASKPPRLTLISETEAEQIVRRVKKSARARTDTAATENPSPEFREYAGKQTPRNRPSGKAAGLRPSTGSKKRLRYEPDFEDRMDLDEDEILKKKSKKSHYFIEEEDDDDEDEDNDGVEHDEDSSSESKPYGEKNDIPVTQLVIRAEKLPSTEPKGPNKTWVCEEPDCGYIVRAAHEENGRILINAHYEEHEKEAQYLAQETALDRENLAVQEATRGHMPINHLLEKIRNLGEKSKQRDGVHINGRAVPEPIKRTLLI